MSKRFGRDAEQMLAEMSRLDTLIDSVEADFEEEVARVEKALAEARVGVESFEQQRAAAVTREEMGLAQIRRETEEELAERELRLQQALAAHEEKLAVLDTLIHEKTTGFEFIGQAWADYELAVAESQAEFLEFKEYPALVAAELVREKGAALAQMRRKAKLYEWIVNLYEFHFPWLTDLRELDEEQGFLTAEEAQDDGSQDAGPEDPAFRWLSKDEWQALPSAQRNQLALDRYVRSRKTNWQIGRDYERYVGYLREKEGCSVTYHGIIKGFEDLGRDLIAERGNEIEVIQCKCWSRAKVIHEKHVFQLFGTMVAHRIEQRDRTVRGTFVTSTRLSDRALAFARELDIAVEQELPLADYPRIKCNVARGSGERIYHLPFDRAYDATVIEPERGESYAATVAEAEAAGFRRAFRWRGTDELSAQPG
jgi:hypothetical protein